MANELAVKETASMAEVSSMKNMWDVPSISQRDIIIPSILLMQPMSPQVTEGKAAFGEFRETLNDSLLGKFEDGLEFIPFKLVKMFIVRKDNEDKEFIETIQITPENENLAYQDEIQMNEDGRMITQKIIRDRVMKFYVLLKKELEEGAAIPYTIALKRTSIKAGQKLATQMFIKNLNSGKTPASMVMKLTCKKMTQDNKTWAASDVAPSGTTPDKWISEAFRWLEIVNSGKAKEQSIETVDTKTGEIKENIPF